MFRSILSLILRRRDPTARQVATLCYRGSEETLEFLLVTSRGRGNWILPKGWPETGVADPDMAAQEAFEEAGVRGQLHRSRIGSIEYDKTRKKDENLNCRADVYALKVEHVLDTYPESGQRERAWYTREDAVNTAAFPQLKDLLSTFDPPSD